MKGGPIQGADIAVYKVQTTYKLGDPPTYLFYEPPKNLEFVDFIWPACFPRDQYPNNHALIATWFDAVPRNLFDPIKFGLGSLRLLGKRYNNMHLNSKLIGIEVNWKSGSFYNLDH